MTNSFTLQKEEASNRKNPPSKIRDKLAVAHQSWRLTLMRRLPTPIFIPRRRTALSILEWFSNTTGTSVDNGARSENTREELGRLRRRVLTELWFSKEVRGDCGAHVLERFLRCYFTFPRLLIDTKQARCFSFWISPFWLITSQVTRYGLFSFDQRDCDYWEKLTFLASSSAFAFSKLNV